MPSLKAIRTRIASVKSTQKITRAMKLVSAARQALQAGPAEAVCLVFNECKAASPRRTVVQPTLPMLAPASPADTAGQIGSVYEPSRAEAIATLIPLCIESQIYRARLESVA